MGMKSKLTLLMHAIKPLRYLKYGNSYKELKRPEVTFKRILKLTNQPIFFVQQNQLKQHTREKSFRILRLQDYLHTISSALSLKSVIRNVFKFFFYNYSLKENQGKDAIRESSLTKL